MQRRISSGVVSSEPASSSSVAPSSPDAKAKMWSSMSRRSSAVFRSAMERLRVTLSDGGGVPAPLVRDVLRLHNVDGSAEAEQPAHERADLVHVERAQHGAVGFALHLGAVSVPLRP